MFKKKKKKDFSGDAFSNGSSFGNSNINDLIDRVNRQFDDMSNGGKSVSMDRNESYTINGKKVSKEEMERNQREMKQMMEERLSRMGNIGGAAKIKQSANSEYILNGKKVSKEEMDAASSKMKSDMFDEFK